MAGVLVVTADCFVALSLAHVDSFRRHNPRVPRLGTWTGVLCDRHKEGARYRFAMRHPSSLLAVCLWASDSASLSCSGPAGQRVLTMVPASQGTQEVLTRQPGGDAWHGAWHRLRAPSGPAATGSGGSPGPGARPGGDSPAQPAPACSAAAPASREALLPRQQNDGQKIEKLSPTSVLLS